MPTYDYECTGCGHRFEAFQKMTDAPLTQCPSCKGDVRRLIGSGMGLIFKGSGFYSTDYKKKAHSSSRDTKEKSKCSSGDPSCEGCPKQDGEKST